MPSPFPGMDPYLEGNLWTGFHGDLATEARRQLAATLAPKYFPFSTRYVVYEKSDYPDVEVPHHAVEIRELQTRRLLTVIEFVSPVNKYGSGRDEYLHKRRRLLSSSVHLVEFDLLLQGNRLPLGNEYPAGDYFCLVSQAQRRPMVSVWPVMLDQPLPTIPIPLADDDADATLDMQLVFNNVYDLGSYQRGIDYRQPPPVELSAAQAAIVDEVLRKAGYKS